MKYIFTLYDTTNNKVVEYSENTDWEQESTMLFQWTENNYDCDCNRSLFMYNWEVEYDCGEHIKLLKIRREDGTLVTLPD